MARKHPQADKRPYRSRRKSGPMSDLEKRITQSLVALNPETNPNHIAHVLNRRKATVACHLEEARRLLQEGAPVAAVHVLEASAVAAMKGDSGPAQWLLEHVSARKPDGAEVRVIDRPSQVPVNAGVRVHIGFAVGNIPGASSPVITSDEVKALPASDSSDET